MANTFSQLWYHLIWSTKNRAPYLDPDHEERIWSYLAGIAKAKGMHADTIGGVEDHVHLLIDIPKTLSVSKALQHLKGGSSSWINEDHILPNLRGKFNWQDGYGAFTVSASRLDAVRAYIKGQREHHRTRTFEEEIRELFRVHGMEFNPEYDLG